MSGNVADQPVAVEQKTLTRRSFLFRSSLAAAGGLALYSGEFARHEISVTTHPVAIDRLPDAFHDFRIVQLSDIHFDEYTEPAFLRRIVGHVNSLAPDLVLLTGDFISYGPLPQSFSHDALYRCADVLRGIACQQRFAVMGNHDAVLKPYQVHDALATGAIPLLLDQYVAIERGGKRLWLSGIADPVSGNPNLDLAIPRHPDGPILLMSHGPDYADNVIAHPRGRLVDLMFSGHTHGGQVRLPFLPPLHLPSGGQKYVVGPFRLGRTQLYVNRGIGSTGVPFRLNCPPEITLFKLQSSEV